MGCAASKPDPKVKEADIQNDKIDRQIRSDKKSELRTVKILLLGAGESGKSTIIKQMRIIHSSGFQEDEKIHTRSVIYSNILVACKVLLEIVDSQKIAFEHESTEIYAAVIEEVNPDANAEIVFRNSNVREALYRLWTDAGVQKAVAKGHEYAPNDNMHYYFDNLDRLFDPNWMPTDQDILHARLRTTGLTETFFDLKDISFRMMDVGGQRSERKKWIHCFEGVQCLLFLAALSGYDQSLLEDVNANQMHEALMLFESLINSDWFKDKPIILFLNKIDLFRDKLKKSPIRLHFPDYQGSDTNEVTARQFFANKFRAINKNANREIYIHFTNATDTNLLRTTMQSVQDILIQKQLNRLIL
ncbi:hypothetical protein LTR05_004876 [Lithohypha guttulata]|uniref:Guanine nucleotide-binding protein alpha-2 subunit n=2 Tax=Lithohypha guttulata TaxID=1690604 RepID=A0AAN7Y679_9EURO|nr:hypothetical protein LTR05_004876 [Lithohypha guttulata]